MKAEVRFFCAVRTRFCPIFACAVPVLVRVRLLWAALARLPLLLVLLAASL